MTVGPGLLISPLKMMKNVLGQKIKLSSVKYMYMYLLEKRKFFKS